MASGAMSLTKLRFGRRSTSVAAGLTGARHPAHSYIDGLTLSAPLATPARHTPVPLSVFVNGVPSSFFDADADTHLVEGITSRAESSRTLEEEKRGMVDVGVPEAIAEDPFPSISVRLRLTCALHLRFGGGDG